MLQQDKISGKTPFNYVIDFLKREKKRVMFYISLIGAFEKPWAVLMFFENELESVFHESITPFSHGTLTVAYKLLLEPSSAET